MVLLPPHSLKVASLKIAPSVRMVGEGYIPQMEDGVRNLLVPQIQWRGQLAVTSAGDLLQQWCSNTTV